MTMPPMDTVDLVPQRVLSGCCVHYVQARDYILRPERRPPPPLARTVAP